MRTAPARRAVALASVGALLGIVTTAAACAGPERLPGAAVEDAVIDAVAPVAGPGAADATCPAQIDLGEGVEVRCTVTLAGDLGTIAVTVRQLDDDGSLEVAPDAVVVDTEEVARELRRTLARELDRSADVVCGRSPHRVVAVGATFPCRVTDGDERRSVDVTVADGAGTLSFELLPAGS